MVMRGESIIRPRPSKHRKDKDREIARRAKEALAKAAPATEGQYRRSQAANSQDLS